MTPPLDNITLHWDADGLGFGHGLLRLRFSDAGHWLELAAGAGGLIQPDAPTIALDFRVGGIWQVETMGARLTGAQETADAGGAALCLTYDLGGLYDLEAHFALSTGLSRLERSARVTAQARQRAASSNAFQFDLPGHLAVGDEADCAVDVPGPWFLNSLCQTFRRLTAELVREQTFHVPLAPRTAASALSPSATATRAG